MNVHTGISQPLDLAELARSAALSEVLLALGEAVTGRRAYLLSGQHVLMGASAPVIDRHGSNVSDLAEETTDPVLRWLGLRLCRTTHDRGSMEEAAVPALLLRAGLLGRMLDRAYAHLKPRSSFGRKTIHHQLVKAEFADAHALMTLTVERAKLRLTQNIWRGVEDEHAEFSAAELRAEKLMGGHGYLEGGTHELAYVSMLIRALYGRVET